MVGFYVFMLLMTLLIPATMLFFGYLWQKRPPDSINYSYGYRTRRSMSSEAAWDYAHRYCGKLWVKWGWFTALVTVSIMIVLAFITMDITVVGIVGGVLVCLQCFPLCIVVPFVERELNREFKI